MEEDQTQYDIDVYKFEDVAKLMEEAIRRNVFIQYHYSPSNSIDDKPYCLTCTIYRREEHDFILCLRQAGLGCW